MKNIGIILLFCVLFFGAGCGKTTNDNFKVDMNADCAKADYPFACFLDKATSAKDPNLCINADSKRTTCISAYEELLETEVNCSSLQDSAFQMECEQLHGSRNKPSANTATTTEDQMNIDSGNINN